MICPIAGQGLFEVDVYVSTTGGINFEPFYKNTESEGAYETSLETLVDEFITYQRNGATGRIEYPQTTYAFMLRDALARSLEMLDEALFDEE